tara:strand:+ start:539 stop:1033 length:495 start_codon:yes stop_codon:yes gene_type:complete
MSQNKIINKTEPSICIPRTFPNISWKRVKDVFEQVLDAKCVDRIDMVRRRANDGSEFKRVYVHFKYWPGDTQSQDVRQRLLDGNDIKIVYDDPWFWKCSASRVPRPRESGRRNRSRPFIKPNSTAAAAATATLSPPTAPPCVASCPSPSCSPATLSSKLPITVL